jgi:type IV fimbrial biogenesis protein FimT
MQLRLHDMQKIRGFTLIEVMVTIGIVAILIGLAIPSFKYMIQTNTISSNVNNFLGDMRYARSEAIKRGGNVVMCRSDSPEAASPVCATGSTNTWVTGWMIFHDLNGNGTWDSGPPIEPILRVQGPIIAMDSITATGATNSFVFKSSGRLPLTSAETFKFGGGNYASAIQRVVCVNIGGYARISGNGAATCP